MHKSTESKAREALYVAPRALSFPVETTGCVLASGDPPAGDDDGTGNNENLGDDEELP